MIPKAKDPTENALTPVERVLTFHVEGLGGLACERRVETAVEAIPGVRQARARSDLGVLEVFVRADGEADIDTVLEAVKATGHEIHTDTRMTS